MVTYLCGGSCGKTDQSFALFSQLEFIHAADDDHKYKWVRIMKEEVDRLDEDKMMTHILDCLGALSEVQRLRMEQKKPLKLTPTGDVLSEEQCNLRNKLFVAAAKTILEHVDRGCPDGGNTIDKLCESFPDTHKLTDGRGWLPLHWVVALGDAFTVDDVKKVCEMDPLALRRHHGDDSCPYNDEPNTKFNFENCTFGLNPAHMLCLEPATERNMELLKFVALADPRAITMSAKCSCSLNSLHMVCQFDVATVESLQFLLQVDSAMLRETCSEEGGCPLGLLCRRACINGLEVDNEILKCLLDADSSAAVIFDAARECLRGDIFRFPSLRDVMSTLKLLMTANPAAIAVRDSGSEKNLVHFAIESLEGMSERMSEGMEVIEYIISLRREALQEADRHGNLPAHLAARYDNDKLLEMIVNLYPQAATVLKNEMENLLHCATHSSIAAWISSRYPQMIAQRDNSGQTPLLNALIRRYDFAPLLIEAGGRDVATIADISPMTANYDHYGYLPLHYAVQYQSGKAVEMLLQLYPEAVGIEAGRGEYRGTPYSIARRNNCGHERQLLRAAPHVDPAALRDLNWAARRMAMFLAFRAVSRRAAPNMLARLRFENKDLVKHVVSFL